MDSDDEDDEDTVENYSDYYSSDPWGYLRAEVRDTLNPSYVKQVEQFLDKGVSRAVAKAKALNFPSPAQKQKLCRLYLHNLKWLHGLRQDPIHQEVMNTLRRFMDKDSIDYEEAAEVAVDKRKFLLNRLFDKPQVPEEEEK